MVFARRAMFAQAVSVSVLALTVAVPSANAQPSNTISGDGVYLGGNRCSARDLRVGQPRLLLLVSPLEYQWRVQQHHRLRQLGLRQAIRHDRADRRRIQDAVVFNVAPGIESEHAEQYRTVEHHSRRWRLPGGEQMFSPEPTFPTAPATAVWYRLSSLNSESTTSSTQTTRPPASNTSRSSRPTSRPKTLSCSTWSLVSLRPKAFRRFAGAY